MVENSVEPQLIVWDAKERSFKVANLVMPTRNISYSLESNVGLGEGVALDSLNFLGSVFLGDFFVFEERLGNIVGKNVLQRRIEYVHGTVCGIVDLAQTIARDKQAPYFSVDIIQDEGDKASKFTIRDSLYERVPNTEDIMNQSFLRSRQKDRDLFEKERFLGSKRSVFDGGNIESLEKPRAFFGERESSLDESGTQKFVFHPTVNLYVPK